MRSGGTGLSNRRPARVEKHREAHADNTVALGIQFRKLKDAIEGRQTRAALTQIIGQLQRDEIRRGRGTAEAPTEAAEAAAAVTV
jgi:hypothetical protein